MTPPPLIPFRQYAAEHVAAAKRWLEGSGAELRYACLELRLAVEALAYVSNPEHAQYRGGLSLEAQAEVIARAVGPRGPNREYLLNTVASLDALGLHDPDLARLVELIGERPE